MEYREPSRIVAAGGRTDGLNDDAESPPRARRFDFARPTGRIDARRVAAALLLTLSVALAMAYVGGRLLNGAVRWLHGQPRYQLRFDQIQLVPPPPSCFRGGAPAFLERARRNAEESEVLPLLDLAPGRVELVFKRFPWVERVDSIERPPGGLIVHLAYNEPVAKLLFPTGEQFVLDRRARILPPEDLDVDCAGGLIQIIGREIIPPSPRRAGLVWKTDANNSPEVDRGVIQAARLAGFLLDPDRRGQADETPALRVLVIATTEANGRGLFVQNAEGAMILWGSGPGDERPGEPSAPEKWELLAAKAKTDGIRRGDRGDYWAFVHNDLKYMKTASPRSGSSGGSASR